jgi:dCTP deaminase
MIINRQSLAKLGALLPFIHSKERSGGTSYGLSEVGYDLRIKQKVQWVPPSPIGFLMQWDACKLAMRPDELFKHLNNTMLMMFFGHTIVTEPTGEQTIKIGRTALASSIERFTIPKGVWCEFRNKSTHARCFVDASLGTDGEPGWEGHLTIEIVFHDNVPLTIHSGSGIMKAVFHELKHEADYGESQASKYQNQPDRPVPAIKD